MLFKQAYLGKIKSGKINLAFRKWKRPSVKKGSLIKTTIGQVEIVDIVKTRLSDITPEEALNAGFEGLENLIKTLNAVKEGDIYKIHVRYHSPDPRIGLRAQTELTAAGFDNLRSKLERLDKYSKQGAWTLDILKAIHDNPQLKAADLAIKTGKEKEWLKLNIRKLKNLGLTISHNPGYTISPLGKVFLSRFGKNA